MEVEAVLTSSLGRTVLGNGILTIGRAADNGLVVRDPTVTSHHAEIRPDGQGYTIVDLGSTNGTFVNGQRLAKNTPRLLHSGDTFRIGDFTFTYEEEYPTSWRDTTNATSAIGETTEPTTAPVRVASVPPIPPVSLGQNPFVDSTDSAQHYNVSPSLPPQQAQPMNLAQEHLQFAAFHPRAVPVETWNTLLVYAYIESALQAFRYRKIFTSYSHIDMPIVFAIRRAYEAIGDDSFLDFENLRSGQNWNAALLRMIDNSDIFQLFWSDNSARSSYVYQECQYALQHYKYDGFIRPVYWERPMRPPPVELSHLHFAYYELSQIAMINKKNSLFSRFFGIFSRER